MQTKELKIGEVYAIHHKKKGRFVAQLIDIVPAPEEDKIDDVFLTMKYDTRAGTDQANLAIVPGKSHVRVSNLRPSFILKIEKTEKGGWLREIPVQEEEQVKSDPGFVEKVRNLLRRD